MNALCSFLVQSRIQVINAKNEVSSIIFGSPSVFYIEDNNIINPKVIKLIENDLAPIVLFAYNRPWHTQQVLDALSMNYLSDMSVLYIY